VLIAKAETLMDATTPAARSHAGLVYPFAGPPDTGATLEVAPGILWLRMPMPFKLSHINLWAIADGDGWALVDTGLGNAETSMIWEDLLANALGGRPVTRVIVTHMHPDHVGLAGWLTRRFGVRLWMTALEYFSCRAMVSDSGRAAPPEALEFYRQAGWNDAAISNYCRRFGTFGNFIHALPESFRRIEAGEEIVIGGRVWRVLVGTGHSPAHACLYCPELKLFISGDQVLPRISSNVSVHPTEPTADPMSGWLRSIASLRRDVPDDVLVLPAHNECFRGLHARLDRLAAGQEEAHVRLRGVLDEPKRAIDVFGALFSRPIDPADGHLLSLATGESIASLNHLIARGEVAREVDGNGVAWYQLAR
jgi:glyoxylase-like metal-dependent hydrolase (beta-lactamase superfamily II)